ncbi:hypothetical protein H0H93_006329, partial [Arthromyces matolae]
LIGKGQSGRVYLALDKASKTHVALKVIQKRPDNHTRIMTEQEIHCSLSSSPFVLPLLASFHDTKNFYLVTPYLGGHDLAVNIGVEGRFSEERARFYAAELVLHRDLKPSNIALTSSGHVRVFDFGLSTRVKKSQEPIMQLKRGPNSNSGVVKIFDPDYTSLEQVGTPPFMSPDVHVARPYSYEADLHALGVSLYKMTTGRLPFGDGLKTYDEILEAVFCEQLTFRPEDPISEEAKDLFRILMLRDSNRPASVEQVMGHPWFKTIRWDRIRTQASAAKWKPHIPPIPKTSTVVPVEAGVPCYPDPYPQFTFISEDLQTSRARTQTTIFSRFSRLFSGRQASPAIPSKPSESSDKSSLQAPPSPPLSPPSLSASFNSSSFSNPPPTPPPNMPLPPLPTAIGKTYGDTSNSSLAFGELPPLSVRQGLARRVRPPVKHLTLRGDMTLIPTVTITPAEENTQETVLELDSPLRTPLGDVTNRHLLSPSDAERPSFTPAPTGTRVKLSAPPKKVKRANKENASQSMPRRKDKTQSIPIVKPIMVSGPATPKLKPLLTVKALEARSGESPKPRPKGTSSSRTNSSPPKSVPLKEKPAFTVPVKIIEPKVTPQHDQSLRGRKNTAPAKAPPAKPSTCKISIPSAEFVCREGGAYPVITKKDPTMLQLTRAVTAKVSTEPQGKTPRPAVASKKSTVKVKSRPASGGSSSPSSRASKANTADLKFTVTPLACGELTLSSHAISKESIAGFYGVNTPRINIDPVDLKEGASFREELAKATFYASSESRLLSSCSPSPSIKAGPHYAGYVPEPSSNDVFSLLRRLCVRVSMLYSRARSWFKHRNEPPIEPF